MSKWINASINERRVMLQTIAKNKGIVYSAVEKDWWVTLTLKALFSLPYSAYLLFKGGTSLSKGWNLIKRFSEDIDLTISQKYFSQVRQRSFALCQNNQQIKKLRIDCRDFITDEFCPALTEAIRQMGINDFSLEPLNFTPQDDGTLRSIDHDSDPTVLILKYTSIARSKLSYVPPMVKIEISCLGMDEPFEMCKMSSLISEEFPTEDDEMSIEIPTVLPTRTFLEKVFLLNEEFQRSKPRSLRMSRHLYDLGKIMDTKWAIDAIQDADLYTSIVNHRKRFYHVGGVNYDLDFPQFINFIPTGELKEKYRTDYADMLNTYIYDKQSAPNFDELIEHLKSLLLRFRQLRPR